MTHSSTLDLGERAPRAGTRSPMSRRPSGGIWPWVPALLLATLIGTQMTVLVSVLDDPTFATEPDYYRKAVDWDARMARQRQSRALGWAARASVESPSPDARELMVHLVDARGLGVSGARLRATALHNARAASPLELAPREVSPGVYRADLGPARPGLWELRLAAQRGEDSYDTTLRFELEPTRSAP